MSPVAAAALAAATLLVAVPGERAVRTARLTRAGRLAAPQGSRGREGALVRGWRATRLRQAVTGVGLTGAVGVVAVAGGVTVASRGAVLLVVPAAAVLGASLVVCRGVVTRRAAGARHRDIVLAVRVLVGELESGARPAAALAAAAEAGPAVGDVVRRASAAAADGGDVAGALAAGGDADLALLGTAWRLGDATGAALAAVLARVCADLAAADAQRRSVAVALAGPRSSAVVLAGLPVLGIALGAAMGARPLEFLTGDPAGRLLCCVGVLLDVAGVLWLRAILRRAERT